MILKQRLGKMTYNGSRLYIQDETLERINLKPGSSYRTDCDVKSNTVTLRPSLIGNLVSSKTIKKRTGEEKTIGVIDKSGSEIRSALSDCSYIKITFVKDEHGDRVVIQGFKDTASVIKTQPTSEKRKLRTIEFCSGIGISAEACREAGFESVAFCEWNPKNGSEDRYAEVFKENHPQSVMFNIPLESIEGIDLPDSDVWVCTLDCTDFSKLSSGKTEFHTMHLFIHLMRLFYQRPKESRPRVVMIENVEGFERIAGNSLKLCFENEHYHVTMKKLNSLEFGSRTKRERFFFVASAYDGFEFPEGEGRVTTPIDSDGVVTVENLDWVTPETDLTIKRLVEREKGEMSHNHKMRTYDITKDAYIGTIPRRHANKVPENLIRHPYLEDHYAFLLDPEHLRYFHSIPEHYYLGSSRAIAIEGIGQGVCYKTFYTIAKKLHDFLYEKMFTPSQTSDNMMLKLVGNQYCFI